MQRYPPAPGSIHGQFEDRFSAMKPIHHLSTAGLLAACVGAVIVGEATAWYVTKALDMRFPVFTVGVVCIGIVAAAVSFLYDGRE